MRTDITFRSCGEDCAGWLCLPNGAGEGARVPAIVMAHGFSAVKEQGLPEIARRFAEAGFAAVVFDYRTFGASSGEPRGQIFALEMIEDYRNAITWARRHPKIDPERIGVWGTSYSGGIATRAATVDRRVKAVVAQVPGLISPEQRRSRDPDRWERVGKLLTESREARFGSGEVDYIPVVAPEGAPCALPGQESYDAFMQMKDGAPGWRNEITLQSLEKMREFDPVSLLPMLAPTALLVIAAETDSLIPLDAVRDSFGRAGEPKRMTVLPMGHFEVYAEPWLSTATDAAVDWYRTHLG